MKTISIKSGFQRGGSLLSWDGQKFNRVQRASENTWVDDGDSSFSTEVADDFKGAVTRFWGISSLSYCNCVEEFLGFSNEELNAPSPVKGWASCQGSCIRSSDDWRLDTMADYLTALARVASIYTVEQAMEKGEKHPSGNGKVLVNLGLDAGDQAADAFAVLDKDGNILVEEAGCGDGTPYPIQTTDGWDFSCERDDVAKEMVEYEDSFWKAAEKIGVAEQYRNINWNIDSQRDKGEKLSRQIQTAMSRTDADARANADKTGVLSRLLKHYRKHMNPLKSLRSEKGGTWTFHREQPLDLSEDSVVYHGDAWWVVWVK